MQAAYAQANETVNNANTQAQGILDSATNDANSIRVSAISYTDEMLATLSTIMADALNDAGAKYNSFVSSLQACYRSSRPHRRKQATKSFHMKTTKTKRHNSPATAAFTSLPFR